jgi:hypothetical protein
VDSVSEAVAGSDAPPLDASLSASSELPHALRLSKATAAAAAPTTRLRLAHLIS